MAKGQFPHGRIAGSEIPHFASHTQINKFILFQIYQDWNAHTPNLMHPYFDFENEEVKAGLKSFKNILSRHISVSKEDFRPLLENALYNTLRLILDPTEAIEKFFFKNSLEIPVDLFVRYSSYFSDFDFVFQALEKYYTRNAIDRITRDDFLEKFNRVVFLYEEKGSTTLRVYQQDLFLDTFNRTIESVVGVSNLNSATPVNEEKPVKMETQVIPERQILEKRPSVQVEAPVPVETPSLVETTVEVKETPVETVETQSLKVEAAVEIGEPVLKEESPISLKEEKDVVEESNVEDESNQEKELVNSTPAEMEKPATLADTLAEKKTTSIADHFSQQNNTSLADKFLKKDESKTEESGLDFVMEPSLLSEKSEEETPEIGEELTFEGEEQVFEMEKIHENINQNTTLYKSEGNSIDLFSNKEEQPIKVLETVSEPQTLAQKLTNKDSGKNLADSFSGSAEIDLTKIPVHKQFQYVQMLFGGSNVKFKIVLDKIGQVQTFEQAQGVLDKYVFNSPEVDPGTSVANEFVEMIQNHF